MKKIITALFIIFSVSIFSQSVPQGINYQAVARDNAGLEITNSNITVRFTIGNSSVSNVSYNYQETHNLSTNQFGLFNTVIGQGTISGANPFNTIGWDVPQYLLVEIDFGSGYEQMGVATPFVSVPYSQLAENVVNKELPSSATNNDILSWNGTNWIATSPSSVSETTTTLTDNSDGTFTYQNELGTSVVFDANIDDADADATNEIQDLSLSSNILTITNNGSATPIDLSIYSELPTPTGAGQVVIWNGTNWTAVLPSDPSPTNEIQDITISGNNINISSGTGATLAANSPGAAGQVLTWNGSSWIAQNPGSGADNWGSQTVVTDATLSGNGTAGSPLSGFDGDYANLTNTPTIPTNTSDLTNDSGFLTSETDGSTTNELQNITVVGNAINISSGTGSSISTTAPSAGQVLTWNNVSGAWEAQNPGSGADNWGSQTVVTDATLSGNGTSGSPLSGFDGDYTSLTNTPAIPANTSDLVNDSGFLTTEVDGSTTNEIQTLSSSVGGGTATLSISGGNSVSIPLADGDADATNEFNTNFAVTGANLEITDAGGTLSIPLSSLSSPDTDWSQSSGFVYNTTDNIGIGTSNPSTSLQVEGAESSTNLFSFSGSPKSSIRIHNSDQTNNNYSAIAFTSALSNGSNTEMAKIVGVNTNHTIGSQAGELIFMTRNSLNVNEVMRIDENGNVGVNTSNPIDKLEVYNGNLRIARDDNQDPMVYYSGDVNGIGWSTGVEDSDAGYFKIATGSSLNVNTRLTITDGGKVGIGITNPVGRFDVSTSSEDRASQIQNSTSSSGNKYGLYANASGGGTGENNGGWFDAFGSATGIKTGVGGQALGTSGENRGVYGSASGGATNWAGYFESGNVYMQNRLGVGSTLPYYPLHVAQNEADLTGNSGAFIAIQNSNSSAGPGQLAGIRFRTDGVSVGDGRFKGGIYFHKTGSFGVGDIVFALNTTGSNANATLSDELMRLSRDGGTDGLSLNTVTTGDAGSFINNTLAGGVGLRTSATVTGTGTGNRYGVYSTAWYGQSLNYGVYAYGYGGTTAYGIYANAGGGSTSSYAGYFSGNVNVTGTLSKGGGTFKIDHPLDPENKYLYHSFVESPDMMNIYNGNITTDTDGYATIELPEYFESLNKDFRYQLTVIGSFAQAIVSQKVENNVFKIQTNQPNIEVSWQITGVRKDAWAEQNRVIPEVDKKGDEKGKYIHPDAFGQPENKGIDYENSKRNIKQ